MRDRSFIEHDEPNNYESIGGEDEARSDSAAVVPSSMQSAPRRASATSSCEKRHRLGPLTAKKATGNVCRTPDGGGEGSSESALDPDWSPLNVADDIAASSFSVVLDKSLTPNDNKKKDVGSLLSLPPKEEYGLAEDENVDDGNDGPTSPPQRSHVSSSINRLVLRAVKGKFRKGKRKNVKTFENTEKWCDIVTL